MVGAGGLGGQVVQSLSRIDIGLGVEAGLSVVILAMILDRVTSGFSRPRPRKPRAGSITNGDADAAAPAPVNTKPVATAEGAASVPDARAARPEPVPA